MCVCVCAWRHPTCTPTQPASIHCMLVNEIRWATVKRAHLNGTSYQVFLGIPKTPLRILSFILSIAYHFFLGKSADLKHSLKDSNKIWPHLLRGFWESVDLAILNQQFYLCLLFLFSLSLSLKKTGCNNTHFCFGVFWAPSSLLMN